MKANSVSEFFHISFTWLLEKPKLRVSNVNFVSLLPKPKPPFLNDNKFLFLMNTDNSNTQTFQTRPLKKD